MVTVAVNLETVKNDYPEKFDEYVRILRSSTSKDKDAPEEKFNFIYSFSYFLKKGRANEEYYENLVHMKFDERLEEEMNKVRVTMTMAAGNFYISDRVSGVPEIIKSIVKMITVKKMLSEQEMIEDLDVINSIPEDDLKNAKTEEEAKPLSLDDQLKHAIDVEDYMEAARIRDLINAQNE